MKQQKGNITVEREVDFQTHVENIVFTDPLGREHLMTVPLYLVKDKAGKVVPAHPEDAVGEEFQHVNFDPEADIARRVAVMERQYALAIELAKQRGHDVKAAFKKLGKECPTCE